MSALGRLPLLALLSLASCWDDPVTLGHARCDDAACACPDSDGDGACDGFDACPGDDRADADADGVCDALDACVGDDRADVDLDSVCDTSDRCPGADDRPDLDGDAIRDCEDTCRYDGPTPPELWLLPSVKSGPGLTVTSVELPGRSRFALGRPGEVVTVRIGFYAEDCGCPGCVWVIRAGFADEPRPQACMWLGVPGCAGVSQVVTATLRLPTTPGEHGLRIDRARDTVCSLAAWDAGTRRPDELAMFCVE